MPEPVTAAPGGAVPRRLATAALVVLAVLPLLASSARLGATWVPQGDDGTIALRGDDVFSSDTPLVGMPSTSGESVGVQVHHPGPLEFQAIGVVTSVLDQPRAPLVAVTLVNLASLLVVLWWAQRLGGTALLAVASAAVAALSWSLRGPILVTPFNPYVAVLPFLAFLVSLAAAWDRRRWAVTAAILFGSWAAQAHLTVTGPVGTAAAALAAVGVWRCWRSDERRPALDRRAVVIGAGVLLVCWVGPLLDAAANEGGNPRALLRAGQSLEEDTIGRRAAMHVVVHAVALPPVWTEAGAESRDLLETPSGADYASAALLAMAAGWVAVVCRRRRPAVTGAVVVLGAAILAGGLLASKIPVGLFNAYALHNHLWLWPASALLWVTTGVGAAHLFAHRVEWRPPPLAPLLAGVAVTAVVAVAGAAPPHRDPGTAAPEYVNELRPQVLDALDRDGRYLLDLDRELEVFGVGTGLLYALEHRGFDVRVPRELEVSFGEHRVDDGQPRRVLVVVPYRGTVTPPDPDAELVATYEPPVELARRRERAEDDLVQAIERRGGVDVAGLGTIAPADARAWVEGGGFLSAQAFALIDPSLVEHPAGRALVDLSAEPLSSFAVFVLPAA